MKYLLIVAITAITIGVNSCVQDAYRTETELSGTKVLIGRVPRAVIEEDSAFVWFRTGYARYTLESAQLAFLQTRSSELRFVLVLGTWCSDSKFEVPRMFKVLDSLNIPSARIDIYGVDRMKKSDGNETAAFAIVKVPTLIVYNGEKEIGRIVEKPRETIETDLGNMLRTVR